MKKLILLAILVFSNHTHAATYYMRADGTAATKASATSCSSASTAMSMATHNASTFSAGDVINLCDTGGNYVDMGDFVEYGDPYPYFVPPSSGSSGGGYITYQAATGQTPVITGAYDIKGSTGNWTWDSTYSAWKRSYGRYDVGIIWINGLPSQPLTSLSALATAATGRWATNGEGTIYIRTPSSAAGNNPATLFTSIYKSTGNTLFYLSGKNYIKLNGISFIRQTHNKYALPAGIYVTGADHVEISGCNLTDMQGIKVVSSTNITISNNTLQKIYELQPDDDENILNDALIGDGTAIDYSSDYTSITGNYVDPSFSTYDGTNYSIWGSGIMGWCTALSGGNSILNAYVANNTVKNIRGTGIILFVNALTVSNFSINGTIENNTVTAGNRDGGNDTDGIACGSSLDSPNYIKDAVIRYNTVDGYGESGIQVCCYWRNVAIYSNVVSNNGSIDNGLAGIILNSYSQAYNNTIYNSYNAGIRIGDVVTTTEVKNNIIHTVNVSNMGLDGNSGAALTGYSIDTYNNAHYATHAATAGTNNNLVTSDPKLKSSTDFHLMPGSPCQDTGASVSATSDRGGNKLPQRSAPSIGAYEYIRPVVNGMILPGK